MKMKLVATLITALLMSGAHADNPLKECSLRVIKAEPNATKTGLAYSETENKKLKVKQNFPGANIWSSHISRSQCMGSRNDACKELKDKCAAPTATPWGAAGMVGGWVQWGDSKLVECPVCPGFSHW